MTTMILTGSPHARLWLSLAGLLCLLTARGGAQAQARWRVDPQSSLAWWQVAPHMNHLWATTCPQDPAWQPGQGGGIAWDKPTYEIPEQAFLGDTSVVPLYPRYWALPVCEEAVRGEVTVADTARWQGVTGEVSVQAAALVTGEDARDAYAQRAVLQSNRYPKIRFTLDSLVDVRRQADTLVGTAVGMFSLRDVTKPMTASVQAWPEADGLRVLAKFRVPASALVPDYGLSSYALGFGVGLMIWQYLYMGVDLVLRPAEEE